jgi:hypothetical protein
VVTVRISYISNSGKKIQDTAELVKVTGTIGHPYCLPNSKPMESEDVYCTVFEKRERQPMLDKYFKEK